MNRKNKPAAQIAVIITLAIVIIILFTVVFINISKVSEKKVESTQVVDRGALYLASQLGSLVHTLKEHVGSGLWGALLGIALVIVGLVLFPIAPSLVTLAMVGLAMQLMSATWSDVSKDMSRYNSLREETLISMGNSLHRDNERVKRIGTSDEFYWDINGNGVYEPAGETYTDVNGNGIYDPDPEPGEPFTDTINIDTDGDKVFDSSNGVYDPPEPKYVLTGSLALEHIKVDFTPRFFAWYWANRATQITEAGLGQRITEFIDGVIAGVDDGLRDYVDVDTWDSDAWQVTRASFTVEPGTFADEGDGDIDVTCPPPPCPDWVAPAGNNRIRIVTIDDDRKEWPDIIYDDYEPFGFLPEKLNSLCADLEGVGGAYDLSFCEDPWWWWPSCEGIGDVIEDLKGFVAETKALLNKPISERTRDITTWLPVFYDINYDRSQSAADGYNHDIYDRLERDYTEVRSWITELSNLNTNTIMPDIEAAHGHNEYGLGNPVSTCITEYNCCISGCEYRCCEAPKDCSFEGIYCSACGSSTPPVCVNKDLYGAEPSWCPLSDRSATCYGPPCGSCSRNPQCPDACDFQGWYGKNKPADPDPDSDDGPTKVKQAIEILEALREDISEIQGYIWNFARDVNDILNQNPNNIRNKFIYAWEDERPERQAYGRCHLIKIELQDYPTQEEFPHLVEKRELADIVKYIEFEGNEEGNFILTVSTYEEDLPTSAGVLKFRKNPSQLEFDLADLRKIVKDVQDNGLIDTTQGYVDAIINNYAITSRTEGHYGPDKEHIYIISTEGD